MDANPSGSLVSEPTPPAHRPLFVHAADLHLGAPLRLSSSQADPAEIDAIRGRARGAWARVVDVALAEGVEFVLLAGDVFDSAEREVASYARFEAGLRRLSEGGIATYIALGNHDPVPHLCPVRPLPEGVVVFGAEQPTHLVHRCADGTKIHVVGQSHASRADSRNLAASIARVADAATTGSDRIIGLVHANLGDPRHGAYAPASVADLRACSVHYWALGHVHSRRVESLGPGRWFAYPGNVQGRGLAPFELGPKGVLVVDDDAAGSGFAPPRFVPCAGAEFRQFEVLLGEEGVGDVDEAMLVMADHLRARIELEPSSAALLGAGVDLIVSSGAAHLLGPLRRLDADRLLVDTCRDVLAATASLALLRVRLRAEPTRTLAPGSVELRADVASVVAGLAEGAEGASAGIVGALAAVRSVVPDAVAVAGAEPLWPDVDALLAEVNAELELELLGGESGV